MLEDLGNLSRNTPLKLEGVRNILTSSQLLQLEMRLGLSVVNHGSLLSHHGLLPKIGNDSRAVDKKVGVEAPSRRRGT